MKHLAVAIVLVIAYCAGAGTIAAGSGTPVNAPGTAALAAGDALAGTKAPQGIAAQFVFQGRLTAANGTPLNSAVQMRFRLYSDVDPGIAPMAVWTSSVRAITPTLGLFTVVLGDIPDVPTLTEDNLAATAAIGVQVLPDAEMAPRQPIQAVFGHTTGNHGAVVGGASAGGSGVVGIATANGTGVEAFSQSGRGVLASTVDGTAIQANATGAGATALYATSTFGNAVVANSYTAGFAAIFGQNDLAGAFGVYGKTSGGQAGVYGITSNVNGSGVEGDANGGNAAGVFGVNANGAGVWGRATTSGSGVYGEAQWSGGAGVYGINSQGNSIGVHGQADAAGGVGVEGSSTNNTGVYGLSSTHFGVWGHTLGTNSNGVGVYGDNDRRMDGSWAGYFNGHLGTSQTINAPAGAVQIDNPLDPANKYLNQDFVSSADMLSVYSGNITTDANGKATVRLPSYVEAVNGDFRYQLTVIGQFAQAIVATEIKGNQFTIMTDKPNVKVSWQVTGVRKDPYAQANAVPAEQDKPASLRGTYLHPELYGQPENKGQFAGLVGQSAQGGQQ